MLYNIPKLLAYVFVNLLVCFPDSGELKGTLADGYRLMMLPFFPRTAVPVLDRIPPSPLSIIPFHRLQAPALFRISKAQPVHRSDKPAEKL